MNVYDYRSTKHITRTVKVTTEPRTQYHCLSATNEIHMEPDTGKMWHGKLFLPDGYNHIRGSFTKYLTIYHTIILSLS